MLLIETEPLLLLSLEINSNSELLVHLRAALGSENLPFHSDLNRPGFILNTILADSLEYIGDELERLIKESKMKPEFAVHALVSKVLKEHKKVIFNGNGYSEEWRQVGFGVGESLIA